VPTRPCVDLACASQIGHGLTFAAWRCTWPAAKRPTALVADATARAAPHDAQTADDRTLKEKTCEIGRVRSQWQPTVARDVRAVWRRRDVLLPIWR
jgi:hypothetical protein